LDWSEVVARRKEALSAGGILDLPRHSSEAYRTTTGAYGWSPYGRILRPVAVQRRVSLVLVTRRQVQPVSLQTRSSPAPGAP